ncbi:MAG TPA: carbohydrate ABC transporter permease, partial [Mesotoga infera]|nr:carbohydrate ABC transporter permease [Mesotoga infera]
MLKLSLFGKIIVYFLLAVYCLIILVPFFIMIMNSLKSMREIYLQPFSFPSKVLFENYS